MVCFGALPLARLGRAHAPFKKETARARGPELPLEATEHICKITRNNGTSKCPGKGRWTLRTVGGGVDSLAQQMEPKAYQSITHQKKSKKVILAQSCNTSPRGPHGPQGASMGPHGALRGAHGGAVWGSMKPWGTPHGDAIVSSMEP